MRSRNSCSKRDLPMPGSAAISMTRSRERASSNARSNTSNSCSRPTKALRPLVTTAPNRVAPERMPSKRYDADDELWVGELTVYPLGGLTSFTPDEADKIVGSC